MTDVLCTICARSGSKGVPRKNIREVGGKPLIAHSIEQALAWDRANEVVVSTDDDEIRTIANEYGASAPFLRPEKLSTDEAAKVPVIQHALTETEKRERKEYDYIVDIDATAPLRDVTDIEDCFQVALEDSVSNAYTVTDADKNPYFNLVELDEDDYAHLSKELPDDVIRRQEAPPVYAMNASVYVYERDFLVRTDTVHGERTKVSIMPRERSVDIDTPLDLRFVEFLMECKDV
ncbi:acylneuraminate cytidylyltransferase family protein [Halobacterium jilantaiense]|uniref:N-acylneuraminate cytidylyltransferase n=1 Tax=Halobacterium jilantaiense TaxID=355548 RepID=A0A1I0MTZ9_9EURY|nr:acylneuraminate cytidylyltransferase family protein [Halobacterium jilantaiense]SEV91831.1 N-acylneuraminate cytidylyltransferase [Halobacterium jilantaiense]